MAKQSKEYKEIIAIMKDCYDGLASGHKGDFAEIVGEGREQIACLLMDEKEIPDKEYREFLRELFFDYIDAIKNVVAKMKGKGEK